MKLPRALFVLHLGALVFSLGGLMIALPHPELWSRSPLGGAVFAFGMQKAGPLYILLGAATMLAWGMASVGPRRTVIFFILATLLPLGAELLGTGTGWPFGAYSYTDGLGFKVAGRVPFTVPLSWFYMGFASYMVAARAIRRYVAKPSAWLSVLLGAWLLTAWDLVLDPAMASPALPARFWVWHVSGPYFGMPLTNLAGWSATGIVFIGLSRLLWRTAPSVQVLESSLPFGVYVANVLFAIGLSLSIGLWPATVAGILLGVLPAANALTTPNGGRHLSALRRFRRSHPPMLP